MSHHRERHPTLDVELPITPMLDMTFQLLVFFLLTFRPQALEGQMDFSLPGTGAATAVSPVPAAGDLPEQELVLVIKTARAGLNNGSISHLVIQSRTGEVAVANLDALSQYLRQVNQDQAESFSTITITADSPLKYACLMEVMDVCRKAGLRVGFAPPADLAR